MPKKHNKKSTDARHEARKIALQALFEWSYQSLDIFEIIQRHLEEYLGELNTIDLEDAIKNRIDKNLALFIVKGVTENLDAIDKFINGVLGTVVKNLMPELNNPKQSNKDSKSGKE